MDFHWLAARARVGCEAFKKFCENLVGASVERCVIELSLLQHAQAIVICAIDFEYFGVLLDQLNRR